MNSWQSLKSLTISSSPNGYGIIDVCLCCQAMSKLKKITRYWP